MCREDAIIVLKNWPNRNKSGQLDKKGEGDKTDIVALNRHVPTDWDKMGLSIGTIVKEYNPDVEDFPCEMYGEHIGDGTDFLRVCVGIIIDIDETDKLPLTVDWPQMCSYHHNHGKLAQTREDPDKVWEIGLLY